MTSPVSADESTVRGKPFSWRFTTPLFIGSALNPINSSMIATALVPIATGLHVSVGQTASLVTALYLASAIAQPTAGKVAEVFGARRVFLAGIVLVLLGGVLGGVAQNLLMLLIARVLIGLGTSCAYPTAMMLIQRRAKAAEMEKPPGGVLGGLQIAGIATASLGLPIGGLLVVAAGWRSVFLVNVPVALIALAVALIWIPRDPPQQAPRNAREVISRIDLTGIIGFAVAMTALLAFLFSIPKPNWIMLAATVVLFVALTLWELRAKYPFVDVRLLVRNGALTRTYLRYALVACACTSSFTASPNGWRQDAGCSSSAQDCFCCRRASSPALSSHRSRGAT
jgi:MFS family permease